MGRPRGALVRRIRHWVANRGWRGFLSELMYRARLVVRGKPVPGRETGEVAPYPFDVAYGVDTAGLVWGESLQAACTHGAEASLYWATGYYGIAPSAFLRALERLCLDWPRFTFVDVGCGKGRALLLALRFPFRRVLGVELSPQLAEVARQNLARFEPGWRCVGVPAEATAVDATSFAVPDGPLLLFLYHPFAAPVMKRFLAHVKRAAQVEHREILLLYANPELAPVLEATEGVRLLWKEVYSLTPEEGAADRFGSHGEQIAAYRLWT